MIAVSLPLRNAEDTILKIKRKKENQLISQQYFIGTTRKKKFMVSCVAETDVAFCSGLCRDFIMAVLFPREGEIPPPKKPKQTKKKPQAHGQK